MNTRKTIKIITRLSLISIILLTTVSCEDLFKDPLKDKDTGDDITLLLLDRNFIKTKLLIWFVDAETNEPMEDRLIDVEFWGDNADKLITFVGEKPEIFSTEIGFLEVGYDPNFEVSKDDPLDVTIIAFADGYISAPQFLSFTRDGTKDIIVKMIQLIPGKPLKTGTYGEPFDIYYNDVLRSDDLRFINDISTSPTGTAYEYISLYATATAGQLLCNNLYDEVAYEDYGVYFKSFSRDMNVIPPTLPLREAQLAGGDFVFSTVLNSGNAECEEGLTISIQRSDDRPGSGSFNYQISFSNGNTQSGRITCTFPSENLIEPIFYPTADPSMVIQVFGDAQYDISDPVNLATPCDALAEFVVKPKSNLHTYKFITQYLCPGSSVGFALSISGQFRKSESMDTWTSFEFIEGICELELVEGEDYEFRVPIDGEYKYYTLPTDPEILEDFLKEHQGDDYQIRELTISTMDYLTEIYAVVEVSDEVCDKIGGPRK